MVILVDVTLQDRAKPARHRVLEEISRVVGDPLLNRLRAHGIACSVARDLIPYFAR